GLGLTLERRVAQPHREDRRDALTDVITLEILVLLLELVLGPGVLVDDTRERGAEAFFVRAAFDRADAVGERVDAIGLVAGAPLERGFDPLAVFGLLEVPDTTEQVFLRLLVVAD